MVKNKRIRKKSERQKLIEKIEDLIREELRTEHGNKCQLCGKYSNNCGIFHILSKKAFPNLRFHPLNRLWAGWFCCHFPYHQNYYYARDVIVPKIKEIFGEDYEDRLRQLSLTLPQKTSIFDLQELYVKLKEK